jgi:hypothetical protein
MIFCSSCNQQRPNTQFGHFFTCNFCRSTNTKSLRRKRQTQPQYHTPPLQQIENHLQKWVALYREYELKLQHRQQRYMCDFVLFCDLQRPLTVEDYLKNSPMGGLTDIGSGVGVGSGVGASAGASGGAGASRGAGAGRGADVAVAGTLAVAVTAQPGPQT